MSGSRVFPGYDHLFELRIGSSERAYRANIDLHREDALTLMRGEDPFHRELTAQWAMGGKVPSDFVGTTLATPVIVSQRVRDLMADEGFTGWVTHPCNVLGHGGEKHDYHLLGITGRCGAMQYEKSELFRKMLPGGPASYLRGLRFDPESWDGSDFFLAGETVIKIVSDRVRRAFLKHKVRNITMTRLTEVEFSAAVIGLELPPPTLQ